MPTVEDLPDTHSLRRTSLLWRQLQAACDETTAQHLLEELQGELSNFVALGHHGGRALAFLLAKRLAVIVAAAAEALDSASGDAQTSERQEHESGCCHSSQPTQDHDDTLIRIVPTSSFVVHESGVDMSM